MATEAQITANRQNAKKSTGPRTDGGKATSSQNAVKHGLFAREAVIHGEDPAEFDLYRDAFLADLRPVGPMESMLAERIVSLSWRLQRAERLQNEAIDEQILKVSGSRVAKVTRSLLPKGVRRTLADSGAMEHDPSLGRALAKHTLDAWLLDRLQVYERRIETSMFRTIGQFRQFQRRREAEQVPATPEQLGQGSSPTQRHRGDLKKQTQFAVALMHTKASATRDYDDGPPGGQGQNKANQSQFQEPRCGEPRRKEVCQEADRG